MKNNKKRVHFVDNDLAQSVHPILVNLIGVGGTGSHVLEGLAAIHETMISLGYSGLVVRAFDEDTVSRFNLGRQRYTKTEVGHPKAAAIINRINRWSGTYWKAMVYPFSLQYMERLQEYLSAQITISCVDTVESRFEIEEILTKKIDSAKAYHNERPTYWMDFGNSRVTGQVMLSTLRDVKQPTSKKYQPVAKLPLFTEEYRRMLNTSDDKNEPSCSTQEALAKQDLFINPTLANWGCRILWDLLSEGVIEYRGLFVNVSNYKTVPVPIAA